jgi:hypothetical protein
MKILQVIGFSLVCCACASTPKAMEPKKEPAPIAETASPAETTTPAENLPATQVTGTEIAQAEETQAEEKTFRIKASELRESISHWISKNPEADFEEAARMANRFLRLHGYPMVLDARDFVKNGETEVKIRSGKKVFHFYSGEKLSSTPDICGERFLVIPALVSSENTAILIYKGEEFPFSLKGFRREKFEVFRGKKLISTIFAPEPFEPIGLSANGKSLYFKFPLNETLTLGWWQKVSSFQPSLLDEEPYLTLRVQNHRLYFDENIEHLITQEFEPEDSDDPAIRWKFLRSNLIIEMSSRCERSNERAP